MAVTAIISPLPAAAHLVKLEKVRKVFFFFPAVLYSLQNLSSPTRD